MPRPWVAQTASRPEAACAGVAPTPRRPASTTANELVNPTSAVKMPASTGGTAGSGAGDAGDSGEVSLSDVTGGFPGGWPGGPAGRWPDCSINRTIMERVL